MILKTVDACFCNSSRLLLKINVYQEWMMTVEKLKIERVKFENRLKYMTWSKCFSRDGNFMVLERHNLFLILYFLIFKVCIYGIYRKSKTK